MSETIEELEKQLQEADKKYWEAFNNLPPGLDFNGLENKLKPFTSKCGELSRKIRMMKTPTFSPIPNYGDVMSLEEFIDCCNSGGFIDYDGSGSYVRDGQRSDITIYPSDVKHGAIRKDFDTIIWFNR